MRNLLGMLIIACALSSCWSAGKIAKLNQEKAPSLDSVLTEVQRQYKMALDTLKKDNIPIEITEAELTLKVTQETTADGEIKVLIFKPSGSYSNSRTTSVAYKLSKKENTAAGGEEKDKKTDFTLRDMIIASARNFRKVKPDLDKLTEKTFTLDMTFSIEVGGKFGLSFDVGSLSVDTGVEKKHTAEHELSLSFALK